MEKLSVIIPAYSKAQTICTVIKKMKEIHMSKDIIVVDDGSTDETQEVITRVKARLIDKYKKDRFFR